MSFPSLSTTSFRLSPDSSLTLFAPLQLVFLLIFFCWDSSFLSSASSICLSTHSSLLRLVMSSSLLLLQLVLFLDRPKNSSKRFSLVTFRNYSSSDLCIPHLSFFPFFRIIFPPLHVLLFLSLQLFLLIRLLSTHLCTDATH